MKAVITQENLQKGLSIVSSAIKKNTTLPILNNVLLEAANGIIKLSSTNLEMGVICSVRGRVETNGKITVPFQLFLNYVSNLPSTSISLILEEKNLTLDCENFHASIKCLDAADFPLIPKISGAPICVADAENFQEALISVIFSSAKDETRPEITGIFLKAEKSGMRLAATDSFRLAERSIKLMSGNTEGGVILPLTTATELSRILGKSVEEKLEIYLSENQIKFKIGEAELISRLVDGQYPDYTKIIPTEFSTKFKVNTEEITSALRASAFFSQSDTNEVEMRFDPKKGKLDMAAESGQFGKNNALLDGKGEGKEEKIVFNYQYLLEGLQATKTDFVNISLSGDAGPAALKPEGNSEYVYIIMPIKK